jgi:hypothetical protein
VHSNEQMKADVVSGGRSVSQHSQLGLSSSIIEICRSNKNRHQPLEALLVDFVEARKLRAVEIQHAMHAAILDERHDNL